MLSSNKNNVAQQSRLIPIDDSSIITNNENISMHLQIKSQNQTPQTSLNENQASILSNKNNEAQQSQLFSIFDSSVNTNSLNQSKLNYYQGNMNQASMLSSNKNNLAQQSRLIPIDNQSIKTNILNQPKLNNNKLSRKKLLYYLITCFYIFLMLLT